MEHQELIEIRKRIESLIQGYTIDIYEYQFYCKNPNSIPKDVANDFGSLFTELYELYPDDDPNDPILFSFGDRTSRKHFENYVKALKLAEKEYLQHFAILPEPVKGKIIKTELSNLMELMSVFNLGVPNINTSISYRLNLKSTEQTYDCQQYHEIQYEVLTRIIFNIKTMGTAPKEIKKSEFKKIQSNLTVKELALLFRLLLEEEVFTEKNKKNYARALVSIFKLKDDEDLSIDNFYNSFGTQKDGAAHAGALGRLADKFQDLNRKAEELAKSEYR